MRAELSGSPSGCARSSCALILGAATLVAGCRQPGAAAASPASAPTDASAQPSDASRTEGCDLGLPLDDARCLQVKELLLPDSLPPSAGNRLADDELAAQLGFLAFYDVHFSPLPELRCATCHLPEKAFTDGKPRSESSAGVAGRRNSPSLLNAAWSGPFFFWDGRADSLWSQPLFALESPDEMGSSRLEVAHALYDNPLYRQQYEALFGALPELADTARFPLRGKPGDPTYDALPSADREAIDLVAANFGKVLEAYMRKLAAGRSALDDFLAGNRDALDATAKSGLTLFARRGCIDCHGGPALSNGEFYAMAPLSDERGRAGGIEQLSVNRFNAAGPYYDQDAGVRPPAVLPRASDEHAFKSPVLRNVARTGPYWHDGRYPELSDVLASGHGATLSSDEQNDLLVLLLSLNGAYPRRPWGDWPAR